MVDCIARTCERKGYIEQKGVTVFVSPNNICETIQALDRKRLRNCKFGRDWVSMFVNRHQYSLQTKFCRTIDHIRYVLFNCKTISSFFAQISLIYKQKEIMRAFQIFNLDNTGFSPGHDLNGIQKERMIIDADTCAVLPRVNFRYNNQFSILVANSADGTFLLPAATFKGQQELKLSNFIV